MAFGAMITGNSGFTQKFVSSLFLLMHPVGTLYISGNPTSPASLFGGTWERIKDTFILAAGDTYAAGSTGGEAATILGVRHIPAHTHTGITVDNVYYFGWEGGTATGVGFEKFTDGEYWSHSVRDKLTVGYTGGGEAHNNMPPYIAVYVWKRIA